MNLSSFSLSSKITQILDLDTETWTMGPALPNEIQMRDDFAAVNFNGTVLVIHAKVYEYSIEADAWVVRPEVPQFPTKRIAVDVTGLYEELRG